MFRWFRRRDREGPEFTAALVKLSVDGKQVLFIMVAADGAINRMGNGSADNDDDTLYMGRTDSGVFEQLIGKVGPDLLEWLGRSMAGSNPVGSPCELLVMFRTVQGEELGTHWTYGLESQGPPPAVQQFVAEAVAATDPWLYSQRGL